jgi:hypothetical protein
MATSAHPVPTEMESADCTPEWALCDLFDIVEDALEKKTPVERKAWLDGLSATAGSSDTQP